MDVNNTYFELLPRELIYKIISKIEYSLDLYKNINNFKLDEEILFRNLTVESFPFYECIQT